MKCHADETRLPCHDKGDIHIIIVNNIYVCDPAIHFVVKRCSADKTTQGTRSINFRVSSISAYQKVHFRDDVA